MKACYQFIESLEPRIAPAILVNGGNLLGGKGNPVTGQTSNGGNTVTLVTVLQGEALVFFDSASNGVITGISVGKHTKLEINGDVTGDIVTNLLPNGELTDSDHNPANGQDGGVLLPNTFLGVTTHSLGNELGSIGRIIAGGSVNNVNVSGALSGIYAGDGIFKSTTNGEVDVSTGSVDYNTISPGLNDIIRLHSRAAQSTAVPSISDVTVGLASHLQVFAGDGAGAVKGIGNDGGSISDITITKTDSSNLATPALYLHSGNGAKGLNGGAGGDGGAITHYTDAASNSFIKLQTGNGGAAAGGTGGTGGSFTDSSISSNALVYNILVGNGGAGATGGGGGSINTITFTDAITGQAPLIATGDFTGDGLTDVLLVNTVTGNATLSEGVANNHSSTQAAFQVVLHPSLTATGAPSSTSLIAPEGSVPSDVVAADLNGDGKLDFVVSYSSSDNLGIFLNQGNGNFTASSLALPASPTKIAVADYLNTGHLDIAVLTAGTVANGGPTLASQIYVAEGNGTGIFSTISAPDVVAGIATDFVSGQLDGTGGVDLAVGFTSGFVDTFLADGSTTAAPFTLGTSLPVFGGPVGNLDLSGNFLLAFTVNSSFILDPTGPPSPHVQLLNVTSAGGLNEGVGFVPGDAVPLAAHFVGSADAIGVVSPAGITIYTPSPDGRTYLPLASIASTGNLSNFVSTVSIDGAFQIDAVGASSSRFFATTGSLDELSGVGTLLPFDIPGQPYLTTVRSGAGGAGIAHNGGAGGSINDFTFTQTFGSGVEQAGARFNLTFATGDGGTSKSATGGGGGTLQDLALSLNPADSTLDQDSTTLAALSTGNGGAGAIGGQGGDMLNVASNSIFDQPALDGSGDVIVNSVALQLLAGNGGNGTHGAGGNGGGIQLSAAPALDGLSGYDIVSSTPSAPGLLVQSGNGGNGSTSGGNGGDLVNIATENSLAGGDAVKVNELSSASIVSGSGGRGGAGAGGDGGAITGLNVSVQGNSYEFGAGLGGSLIVTSGDGGLSRHGIGGSAGSITKATVGSVNGDPLNGVGVLVHDGDGADGGKGGGAGGGIQHLRISSPFATDVYAAVLLAGDGGKATHSGFGGDGGSISGVLQRQDVNSSLNLLQGGDAGTGVGGRGGSGGSVSGVNTVGFIGLPATETADLGAFNDTVASPVIASLFGGSDIPQGIFAGRGAVGGVSGSVIDVVARQIAAIGASVNAAGHFGVAHAVTDVNADLIGNEVVRNNIFSSTVAGHVSPAKAKPVDGFILAASVSDIVTENKGRTAKFTFKG